MKCPSCKCKHTCVTYMEPVGDEVIRKRRCSGCNISFETVERSRVADTVNNFKAQMRGIVK